MMRLWKEEYIRPQRMSGGTATSVVVHATLITLAVIATNPPEGLMHSLYALANRVVYVAPPPKIPASEESREQLKYFAAAQFGPGAGLARGSMLAVQPQKQSFTWTTTPGDLGMEQTSAVESRHFVSYDSVFSIAEVDSAVAIDPSSAAPLYPPALLKLGIEGSVMVRYVVDSLGHADVSTLQVVRASRLEFAIAVRDALPFMRFRPAVMGQKTVPQLVEQPFNFRIVKPDTTAAVRKPPA